MVKWLCWWYWDYGDVGVVGGGIGDVMVVVVDGDGVGCGVMVVWRC